MEPTARPPLSPGLSGTELMRWYWLKSELIGLARELGVPTSGGKQDLTERLVAALDGRPIPTTRRRPSTGSQQLAGPLTKDTVIPPGQRCSRVVRAWFCEQVGPSFRFDGAMRDFFAAANSTTTLHDALDHFLATRSQPPTTIGAQFEYNRFTRTWHEQNPNGSRADLIAAWRVYRRRPIDERGRI